MQRRRCCPLRRGYSLSRVIERIKSAYGGCGAELLVVFTNGRCAKNKQPCMTDGGSTDLRWPFRQVSRALPAALASVRIRPPSLMLVFIKICRNCFGRCLRGFLTSARLVRCLGGIRASDTHKRLSNIDRNWGG